MMKLDKVQVSGFRNLKDFSIIPSDSINLIVGENGSGKSSFLESIHYLAFGRSFRTNKHSAVIQHENNEFTIFGSLVNNDRRIQVGLSRSRSGETLMRIDGEKKKRISDLAKLLPVQLFTPQSSDMLIGSPSLRRKYLDWGLFHVEQSFFNAVSEFNRLLKQRNALLKSKSTDTISDAFWRENMATSGEKLDLMRKSYVEALEPHISSILVQFLPEFSFEISYYRGWEKGMSLHQSLEKNASKDNRYGFTNTGPHKADIRFKTQGVAVHDRLSRGQLRLFMAALQIAQTQLLHEKTKRSCVFLLDDIGAELDVRNRQTFVHALIDSNAQIFVTAIDSQQLNFDIKQKSRKMFHVEHGQVSEE